MIDDVIDDYESEDGDDHHESGVMKSIMMIIY